MKAIVLFLTLSISNLALADVSPCDTLGKNTKNIDKCVKHLNTIVKNLSGRETVLHCPSLYPPPRILDTARFTPAPLSVDFKKKGGDCTSFINPNTKSYGPWGKEIVSYIEKQGSKSIFLSPELNGFEQIPNICPRWKKLTQDQKKHFWVWVMASIAYEESTCIPTARNALGTDEPAVGLFQLNESLKGRAYRGGECKVASVKEPSANIQCSMKIMTDLLKGPEGLYKSSGFLYNTGRNTSYWEKLKRPNGGAIGKLIKTHPYCHGFM